MVHKYGGAGIATSGQFTDALANNTRGGGHEVVHGDTLAWFGDELVYGACFLVVSPGFAFGF